MKDFLKIKDCNNNLTRASYKRMGVLAVGVAAIIAGGVATNHQLVLQANANMALAGKLNTEYYTGLYESGSEEYPTEAPYKANTKAISSAKPVKGTYAYLYDIACHTAPTTNMAKIKIGNQQDEITFFRTTLQDIIDTGHFKVDYASLYYDYDTNSVTFYDSNSNGTIDKDELDEILGYSLSSIGSGIVSLSEEGNDNLQQIDLYFTSNQTCSRADLDYNYCYISGVDITCPNYGTTSKFTYGQVNEESTITDLKTMFGEDSVTFDEDYPGDGMNVCHFNVCDDHTLCLNTYTDSLLYDVDTRVFIIDADLRCDIDWKTFNAR